MSNFIKQFKEGKEGRNIGLPLGLPVLDKAINGLQRGVMIGIAASPKVGKSKLVDGHLILYPYLLAPNADVEWIYYSYEMNRVQKEFAFAVFFLDYDHQLTTYEWNGKTKQITADYLMGRLKDEHEDPIIVNEQIESKLKEIYVQRIIPLFGEHDMNGNRIKKGKIDFIEQKDTCDGMTNYVMNYARENGKFTEEEYYTLNASGSKEKRTRLNGYIPNNPNAYRIIITDTLRKLRLGKGQNKKEAADSWIDSSATIRNLTGFTFVHIIHCNRSLTNMDRLKYMAEFLHPTGDDIKETGNLSEEADYVLTLFNPTDEKYGIRKHFNLELFDSNGNLLYPDYRSLHLIESRHTICPLHMQLELLGAIGCYKQLERAGAYNL